MFSDTHCHFRHNPYDMVKPIINEMEKAGVELALISGVDVWSSEQEILTAKRFSILKACIGVHPWNADLCTDEALRRFKELAADETVVAMSEIGLDYRGRRERETATMGAPPLDQQVQRHAFRVQLRAAKDLNLPVIIHDNTPDQEVLDILKEEGNAKVGAVIHGFDKDLAYAKRCVDMGISMSIGLGILSRDVLASFSTRQPTRSVSVSQMEERERKRMVLSEVVKQIDMKWLLSETDRSNPERVLFTVEKIAELKCLTRDNAGRKATQNLRKLIKL